MKTAIILLNWNGADDTIDCLESLVQAKGGFFAVVVDNDSHDDSMERLKAWQSAHPSFELHLIEEKENHGFAIGNNIGVRYASQYAPDYYMLLNNDTVVAPDFLEQLLSFMADHKEYDVLSPVINYYDDRKKIWFGGGRLKTTGRTALHRGEDESVFEGVPSFPVNYVSGCAMLFSPKVLLPSGDVFSDKFFFGEEDHEFSVRVRNKFKMACVTGAKIYHKIGMSRKKMSKQQDNFDAYIYYLSLYVIYGLYDSGITRFAKFLYVRLKSLDKFCKLGNSFGCSFKLSSRLYTDYLAHKNIDKNCFEEMKDRFRPQQ